VLFDQGTPVPLRRVLSAHTVSTAFEMGWAQLSNGELLNAAEAVVDVLVTTDQNIRHQQALSRRRLAILVLPTTSWPIIQRHVEDIIRALEELRAGEFRELHFTE